MVKRKTVRQKINKKEAKKVAVKDEVATSSTYRKEEQEAPGDGNLSHRVKRKITKQLHFLSRLQEAQRTLGPKKNISKRKHRCKKSALSNLSALAEFLPSLDGNGKGPKIEPFPKGNHAKARQLLVVSEANQLAKVLAHPDFRSNPFSAIHQHLANTSSPHTMDTVKSLDKQSLAKERPKRARKLKVDHHHNMEES